MNRVGQQRWIVIFSTVFEGGQIAQLEASNIV